LKRVAAGEPMREIEPSYNVDRSTISRLKAPYAAEVRSTARFRGGGSKTRRDRSPGAVGHECKM
jgi:hypothetical protein